MDSDIKEHFEEIIKLGKQKCECKDNICHEGLCPRNKYNEDDCISGGNNMIAEILIKGKVKYILTYKIVKMKQAK